MSTHFVRHILRAGDYVRTEFECRATEGAACRTACTTCYEEQRERCECISQIFEEGQLRLPTMGDLGQCGWLPWFDDAPEEMYEGREIPVRGPDWQPITINFTSDGEVYWKYAE